MSFEWIPLSLERASGTSYFAIQYRYLSDRRRRRLPATAGQAIKRATGCGALSARSLTTPAPAQRLSGERAMRRQAAQPSSPR